MYPTRKIEEKNMDRACNYTALTVLFFFVFHLFTTPLTFTKIWHCPMHNGQFAPKAMMHMQHMNSMLSMNNAIMPMDEKISSSHGSTSHSKQKGILFCLYCSIFWLPISIVNYEPLLPSILISIISYLYRIYLAKAPLNIFYKANGARAPPFYETYS